MISAQIKKGNIFLIDSLQDYLLQMIVLPTNRVVKPIKFNYFNFIQIITQILNQFSKSKCSVTFNLFLVDSYVRKYQKQSDLYRHFFGLTQSWKRFADNHQDAKLFLSLLTEQRNNKQIIKRFLKIRKVILKTLNSKILQQISVTHSDALTICHMLFHGQNKNKIIKKINTLFISLKRKLVNTAKIDGAVACQFFMSAAQELEHESYPLRQLINLEQKKKHNNQYLQQKDNYQLSFSQQYASTYNKNRKQIEVENKIYQEAEDSCGEEYPINFKEKQPQRIFQQIQDLQNEWAQNKGILNLDDAKKSLNRLSKKDRDIDAKLQGSGLIKWKNYPEGWDQFIRNNKIQKQKLLNGIKN